MEVVCILNYYREEYKNVVLLAEESNFKELNERYSGKKTTFEDITIVKFKNQLGENKFAIIYDSDELWQDPYVMDIIIPKN